MFYLLQKKKTENKEMNFQRDKFKAYLGLYICSFPGFLCGVRYSFLKEFLPSPKVGRIPWLDPQQRESNSRELSVSRKTKSSVIV